VVLFQNRLLTLMGRKSVARLGDTPIVALSMRQRLEEPGTGGFVYFVEEGVASVIADGGSRMAMELGLIGREGMVGLALVYEDTENPYQTIVQVPGNAIQVDAKKLRSLMQEDSAVRRVLMRFAPGFLDPGGRDGPGQRPVQARRAPWPAGSSWSATGPAQIPDHP